MITKAMAEKNAKELATNVLLSDFPINFFWIDKDGICLGCNLTLAKAVGLNNSEEIIGRSIVNFVSKEVWNNTKLCMAQKKCLAFEESYTDSNEKVFYFYSIKEPILNSEGEVEGVLGVSINITPRKEMEFALEKAKIEAEEANEAKSDFINNVSHEFRIPLSAIVTIAKLYQGESSLSPFLKEYASILNAQAEVLWKLTEKLLDYRHNRHSPITPHPEPVDVVELLQTLIAPIKARVANKSVVIEIRSFLQEDKIITIDRGLLSGALQEILSNAEKFTHNGHIIVVLSYEKNQLIPTENQLTILVQDTGIGIAENKLSVVFQPFLRQGLADSTPYKGIGMGLPVVEAYMKILGGQIKLDSIQGKGTTVKLTLPLDMT